MGSISYPFIIPTSNTLSSPRNSPTQHPIQLRTPHITTRRTSLARYNKPVCRAAANPETPQIITDEAVPEGHRGLHSFLYGDKGSEVHTQQPTNAPFKLTPGEDDGTGILPVDHYVTTREPYKFAGVYAVFDDKDALQYVGFSRNVVLSLKSHKDHLDPSLCHGVRVMAYTSVMSKGTLEKEKQSWLERFGTPPGNSGDSELWEHEHGPPVSSMSEEQRSEYEEKKLKLRKAMGENLHDDVEGEDEDSRTRRMNLLMATEGDDWSGVIDRQTKETLDGGAAVVSPFEGNEGIDFGMEGQLSLTPENVDFVLEEVRPYLISDGGNVEVVAVQDGVVSLRLQGACGTCPSSTTTMKMGIERVMKEKFGDSLKEVLQVDQNILHATIETVNSHLDNLRGAITNYGGSVEVISVENGKCYVKYNGPGPIGMGIQAAIKDKFPDIKNVILLSVEAAEEMINSTSNA